MLSTEPGIAVVTIAGNRKQAGGESADLRSWTALSERLGHVTCVWAGSSWNHEVPGVRVVQQPRPSGLATLRWVIAAVRQGTRSTRAAQSRGQSVVVNGGDPWGWLVASIVARLTRSPFLMDVHGDLFSLPAASVGHRRKFLLQAAASLFARVAAERRVVSATTRDEMLKRGLSSSLVPPRLTPIWDVDLERAAQPLSRQSPSMLVVGRLVASKGYDLLLTALRDARRQCPDLTLTIVGDGPARADLQAYAVQLGLSEAVEFLGSHDVNRVREEMALADLFVISSRDEGLPRTLLEAVAAGLPVVATSVGGIPEATRGWPTVHLVSVDPSSIADGILSVVAEPPDAPALQSMRRKVLGEYGFEPNLDLLADCYRRVAHRQ